VQATARVWRRGRVVAVTSYRHKDATPHVPAAGSCSFYTPGRISPCTPPPGAGRMCGRPDAGAGASLEPASEPEPLPAAGRAAPEHCCRGGRSSGYWVPPLTFQGFFYDRDLSSRPETATGLHKLFLTSSWSLTCFRVAPCLSFFTPRAWSDLAAFPCRRTATTDTRKHLIPHIRWLRLRSTRVKLLSPPLIHQL
jgi:hypothetical protein